MKTYSLRKSRKLLRNYHALFCKKEPTFSNHQKEKLEHDLRELDRAVLAKEKQRASDVAKEIVTFCKKEGLRGGKDIGREVFWAIVFAIAVAFVIRQFWFELYEVPTGSMRPTILELDRLAVSKTTFGIHLPFKKKQLFYKPSLIKRAGIIVLTTAGLDMADPNMLYFGIFPGKKRFVKRCINKPGDWVYFYGGYVYNVDEEGNAAAQLADPEFLNRYHLENLDHVPFITFSGKTEVGKRDQEGAYLDSTIKQMALPVVKLEANAIGGVTGLFYDGKDWIKDDVNALKKPHDHPVSYSDLWGMGNFAMARLLDRNQVKRFYGVTVDPGTPLVLELQHTPSASYPKPTVRRGEGGRFYPMLTPFTALLPLKQEQIDTLAHSFTTTRFCVKKGRAYAYQKGRRRPQPTEFDIRLPSIKDGCYEFYQGQAYNVMPGGFRKKVSSNNGLYSTDPKLVAALFNGGIGWNRLYEPVGRYQPYHPHRYAYYRDGNLYVMGTMILEKDAPILQQFVANEMKKQESSSSISPYIAFVDRGPPLLEDGSLDIEKVKNFGLKVPSNAVIGLGDNYAMSSDSRDFGFVPTDNLRGAPSFIFWPLNSRVGPLVQPPYPWMTTANLVVWILAGIIIVLCIVYVSKRNKKSLFKD